MMRARKVLMNNFPLPVAFDKDMAAAAMNFVLTLAGIFRHGLIERGNRDLPETLHFDFIQHKFDFFRLLQVKMKRLAQTFQAA